MHEQPASRPVSRPEQLVRRFLMSGFGIWFGRYVLPYLDRPLLQLSRGRYSMSPGQPILLLFTTGARSGRRRATPLLYLPDGERLIVVASNGGRERHPAWYHNLSAHPAALVYHRGRSGTYLAHEARGAERAALWARAVEYFEGFTLYESRTARAIPIMVLEPRGAERSE